ncbi:MAG: sulfatase [Planctomycetes bacterium]|nr:sulfatase [Planctomycetota bacterium]
MALGSSSFAAPRELNVLLITADDLNFDSVGVNGCPIPGITPNLDRLAAQGMRFRHSHTPEAVCQPCRQMLMTARYPHHYGAKGFHSFASHTPTLPQALKKAGYRTGILGKVGHYGDPNLHDWDFKKDQNDLGAGRDPKIYAQYTSQFLKSAQEDGKPFFLIANSHDPHRPFMGADGPKQRKRGKNAAKTFKPEEVPVPGFLPDLPDVRKEVAQYFGSVHRLDATVGAVLKALDDSGQADRTLVLFASDHGMAFPFAKTNCYRQSTRSPWMVRWPGQVKPGLVDDEHFVTSLDFAPTILEALGLNPLPGSDGKSFLPLLRGEKQAGRERVLTQFDQTSGQLDFPMRALQDRRYLYIWNGWAGGKQEFKNESQAGLTMAAMRRAAETDAAVAERVKLFLHRVPEEFYDLEADPHALKNLIGAPDQLELAGQFRNSLLEILLTNGDPNAERMKAALAR